MSIRISPNLVGIWFIALPNHDDWMAGLEEIGPNTFKLTWRMRYADPLEPGASPWENIDRKSWHEGVITSTREEAVKKITLMGELLASSALTTLDFLPMNPERDMEKFIDEFEKKPWASLKRARKGTPEWDELVKTFPELKDEP